MTLSELEILVAIVEGGSMRGASRGLNIPQSIVSRSVDKLERELGAKLFERTSSGVFITNVGERVNRRARIIQSELQHTLEEVEKFKQVEHDEVSLGLSMAAHASILTKIIEPFRRRFPKVRLNVVEGLFPALEREIREGLIDLFVGPVPDLPHSNDLVIEQLLKNERMIICRRDHPLESAVTLAELADVEWVTTPFTSAAGNEVATIFTAAGMRPPEIAVQAASWLGIISIVGASDLLAPMPRQWQELITSNGFFARVPIREKTYASPICIARRARRPLAPAVLHLSDLVYRAAANQARATKDVARLCATDLVIQGRTGSRPSRLDGDLRSPSLETTGKTVSSGQRL